MPRSGPPGSTRCQQSVPALRRSPTTSCLRLPHPMPMAQLPSQRQRQPPTTSLLKAGTSPRVMTQSQRRHTSTTRTGHRRRGWQRHAARICDQRAFDLHFAIPFLPRPELCCFPRLGHTLPVALQSGLYSSSSHHPRGMLDPLGDHRAACATSGALASRARPLERAVARVCQEAGARVARNVRHSLRRAADQAWRFSKQEA